MAERTRTGFRARIRDWWQRNYVGITLILLSLVTLLTYFGNDIFIAIHPGEAGVQWSRFAGGTRVDRVYGEGLHAIFPWNKMYKYNVRFQQRSASYDVLSSDGLRMETTVTVRFQPVATNVALLHKLVGPDYVETLLLPELGFHARERIAQYTPEEFYSDRRFDIQREILQQVERETRVRRGREDVRLAAFVFIEDFFLESVALPEDVAQAIQDKLSQLQHLEEYDYIVLREEKEKQRKQIEAEGIRAFQNIVSEGISDRYLRWKGIDATLRLALSQNSKIVVIGAGEGGLPIILGNVDGPLPPDTDAAAPSRGDQLQTSEPSVPTGPGLAPSSSPPR